MTDDRQRARSPSRRRNGADRRSTADTGSRADTDGSNLAARLQRRHGNRAVARLCRRDRSRPSLEVSDPSDPAEREAERVADRMMRSEAPVSISGTASGASASSRRNESSASGKRQQPIEGLRGGGNPLEPGTRSFFEARFDRDFSDVRVHTGSRAHEAARSIGAAAFTLGADVAFANGNYRPDTAWGSHLLAHELAHVAAGHGVDSTRQRASATGTRTDEAPVIHRRGGARPRPRARHSRTTDQHRGTRRIVEQARRDHRRQLNRLRERNREQTRERQARRYRIARENVDGIVRTIRRDSGVRSQPPRNPTQASARAIEYISEEAAAMTYSPEHAVCLDEEIATEAPTAAGGMCLEDDAETPEVLVEATSTITVDHPDAATRAVASLREATAFVLETADRAAVADPNAWRWYALVTVTDGAVEILAVSTYFSRLEMAGWDEDLSVIPHDDLTETFRQTVRVGRAVDGDR